MINSFCRESHLIWYRHNSLIRDTNTSMSLNIKLSTTSMNLENKFGMRKEWWHKEDNTVFGWTNIIQGQLQVSLLVSSRPSDSVPSSWSITSTPISIISCRFSSPVSNSRFTCTPVFCLCSPIRACFSSLWYFRRAPLNRKFSKCIRF